MSRAAGMNPTETHELMETIRRIRDIFGVAVLLIEHDMSLVMGVCERIYVLDYGTLIARRHAGRDSQQRQGDQGLSGRLRRDIRC